MTIQLPKGKYTYIKATYVPLSEGCGCTCQNCGRLIANIVTVMHDEGNMYIIGADCAETILGKKEMQTAKSVISQEKKISEKIAFLTKNNAPFVLHPKYGYPCKPLEQTQGYYIKY